jgi:hypothetical protein
MEQNGMRRLGIILVCWLMASARVASAHTYPLTDGTTIVGDPISINDSGVQFKEDDGNVLPRTTWDKLTPAALQELNATAKSAHDKELLEPLVDNLPQATAKRKEIVVKPITPPARPTRALGIFGLFVSPVGLCILLVLYGANLLAAYEVALYRFQRPATVCGPAAIPILGVLSPIIYLAMPPNVPSEEAIAAAPAGAEEGATPAPGAAAAAAPRRSAAAREKRPLSMPGGASAIPVETPATEAALPAAIVFTRGEYLFNRRFFETKLAGFFRLVPTEAEKDLVLLVKSSRGDFAGRRITRATPTDLYLQVFHDEATADEMIPFVEILEVQIRHKDTI